MKNTLTIIVVALAVIINVGPVKAAKSEVSMDSLKGYYDFSPEKSSQADHELEISLDWIDGNNTMNTHESGIADGGDYTRKIDEIHTLSGLLVGVNPSWRAFSFGLEYGSGQAADCAGGKNDFNLRELKAGYGLGNGTRLKIIPYVGWLYFETGKMQWSGVEYGMDVHWNVSDKISIKFGGSYVSKAEMKSDDDAGRDNMLWYYRLKAEYAVNDHFSLDMGYRVYQFAYQYSNYTNNANNCNGKVDIISDFFTVGFTFRFQTLEQKGEEEPESLEKVSPE